DRIHTLDWLHGVRLLHLHADSWQRTEPSRNRPVLEITAARLRRRRRPSPALRRRSPSLMGMRGEPGCEHRANGLTNRRGGESAVLMFAHIVERGHELGRP